MRVDAEAEKAARAELSNLQIEWKKIIETLRDIEVKPEEDKYYRNKLWQEKDGFKYRLGNFISIELFREALKIFKGISTDLDLALRKGQEKYEQERHRRRIEWARTLGLGTIIILAIVFLIKLLFNIELQIP